MYSEADIYRISLLAEASRAGHLISRLAKLDNLQLKHLIPQMFGSGTPVPIPTRERPRGNSDIDELASIFDTAIAALKNLDTQVLDETLTKAQKTLGEQGFVRRVVSPLARLVFEQWLSGAITLAQLHFFGTVSKAALWSIMKKSRPDARAPRIVVGTPYGQMHDTGAALVASAAATNGWNVCFVGANLPASELVSAVNTSGACSLALSIAFPEDDPNLLQELAQLGERLPEHIRLFVGGRAAHSYLHALRQSGARVLASLEELDAELNAMRRKPVVD